MMMMKESLTFGRCCCPELNFPRRRIDWNRIATLCIRVRKYQGLESGSQAIRRSQRHAALMLSHPHSLPLPLPLSLSLSLLNTLLEMRRIGQSDIVEN